MCGLQTETVNTAQWNKSIFRAMQKKKERNRTKEEGREGERGRDQPLTEAQWTPERQRVSEGEETEGQNKVKSLNRF